MGMICIYVPHQPRVRWYMVQRVLCSVLCLDRVWGEVITSLVISAGRLPQALLSCCLDLAICPQERGMRRVAEGIGTRLGIRTSASLALGLPPA